MLASWRAAQLGRSPAFAAPGSNRYDRRLAVLTPAMIRADLASCAVGLTRGFAASAGLKLTSPTRTAGLNDRGSASTPVPDRPAIRGTSRARGGP